MIIDEKIVEIDDEHLKQTEDNKKDIIINQIKVSPSDISK